MRGWWRRPIRPGTGSKADLGRNLLVETGHLTLGEPDDPWITASRASMVEPRHRLRGAPPAEIARRHPVFDARQIPYALLAARGGVLLADRIVSASRRGSPPGVPSCAPVPRRGARSRSRRRCGSPMARTVEGDALLVTAGAWTPRLVPISRRLTLPRQVVYVQPPPHLRDAWRRTPLLSDIDSVTSTIFYALPPVPGAGLKFGDHRFSLGGDPDGADATPGRDR